MSRTLRLSAIGCAAATTLASFSACAAEAPLKQLKGAQIRAAFAGQEFTDETHWHERYQADGVLTGKSMGRALTKHWSIKADLLCLRDDKTAGDEAEVCREVWKAGAKVELRRPGGDSFPKEGILRRAAK